MEFCSGILRTVMLAGLNPASLLSRKGQADAAIFAAQYARQHTPFKVSGSFAGLRPLSERLLELSPQLICLPLRKLPEVLFKLALHLVPGAFDLKLVHKILDI